MISVSYKGVMCLYVRVMMKLCDTFFKIRPLSVGYYVNTKRAIGIISKIHTLTFKLSSSLKWVLLVLKQEHDRRSHGN